MQSSRPIHLTAALASLILVASGCFLVGSCSGSADPAELTDDGYDALGSGDATRAVGRFEEALDHLEEGTPEYMRAKHGEIEALVQLDAERAKTSMLALRSSADEKMYEVIGSKLSSAGHFQETAEVFDAGLKLYPENPKLKVMMDEVIAKAKQQGDEGALDKLKGLGYIGGE